MLSTKSGGLLYVAGSEILSLSLRATTVYDSLSQYDSGQQSTMP